MHQIWLRHNPTSETKGQNYTRKQEEIKPADYTYIYYMIYIICSLWDTNFCNKGFSLANW